MRAPGCRRGEPPAPVADSPRAPVRGPPMKYLLFPGRHLAHTRFQEEYLLRVLGMPLSQVAFASGRAPAGEGKLTEVVFAITSANRQFSRFNAVPFHVRAIGTDRFARRLAESLAVRCRIL